jgi:DNA mismatch repair ATPase MutS
MLVEAVDVLGEHTHVTSSGGASVYMMCLCEEPASSEGGAAAGDDEKMRIGMVCIDTASGDIVYDEWEDGQLRQNLASRVAHLQPRELLLPQNLSPTSTKLLKRLVAPLAQSQASAVRLGLGFGFRVRDLGFRVYSARHNRHNRVYSARPVTGFSCQVHFGFPDSS